MTTALVAAVALVATTAAPAHAASPAVTCRYTFSSWPGGFTADLAIANSGPEIDGWRARWTFLTPAQATAVWSAALIQVNPREMLATPAPWTQKIPTGGAVTFGWTATATIAELPTEITVNGQRC
ncbi:hypothetical protein Rhe02_05320 [Rhizocola hellebori]|uniref:CBM2 domain-containing protein n=1 Tax=Rhizocola hellebori TaxID=1392758 RepID=A0A8J3Q3B7_9ACTN|nr:cellulose binding domain-containing protein [Rhizocola hellebori]GIH02465.1 hypothetical protein Rhe02_05320 [Rhizocola hellebori]